jgi:GxxExxY protein
MNPQDAKFAKAEPAEELDETARAVIGAAIEVHRHLGPGYLEGLYERALAVELRLRGLPFRNQAPLQVAYKDTIVGEYRIDLLVCESLVVELKAVDALLDIHRAQVMTYLKAGAYHLGLLINFNVRYLREGIRRLIWNG